MFKPGDKVKCLDDTGYPSLTEGEIYTIKEYEPEFGDYRFTWPAYVNIQVTPEKEIYCHARRFEKVKGE